MTVSSSDDRPRSSQVDTAFPSDRNALLSADDSFAGASGILFEKAMAQTRMAVCLSDPSLPDMPIVYANRAFRELTGYESEEILGRNCRFLQGPRTDAQSVARVRKAIETEDVAVVELLNYRKDGSPFWNALHIGPIYDEQGKLAYFFGSQWDLSDMRIAQAEERHARTMSRELSHRMKNMFSVISGVVSITGRTRGFGNEAAEINKRIAALGRAYETTLDDAVSGTIDAGPAIRAILQPFADTGRLTLQGGEARVSFQTVSTLGLILHELADNAKRHGAWSNDAGSVTLSWHLDDDLLRLDWSERGGPIPNSAALQAGAGMVIADRLARTSGGAMERIWTREGLDARLIIRS